MPIQSGSTGKCPHCNNSNRFEKTTFHSHYGSANLEDCVLIQEQEHEDLSLETCRCTSCGQIIIFLDENMIYPLGTKRGEAPSEVSENIARDFNEACLVENLSKKASAALGRRCLQNLLNEKGIKKNDLSLEIEEAIKILPSHLSESIDAIRNIGNFAAHPLKSTNTGEIVEVEEGETEWILDTLEGLFDYFYVQPALTKRKREDLNKKLAEFGKPNMK
ncbi:MAG: hypothetical protein UR61_C0052G0001 [candidate division WS6 bacterium GW2011_GWE1_34_7]|uniref:DUF4145 domain-containing protein n=2 Tax=Candidatus Dojkabacteria TaxID=74243 RepID=A0A0G0B4E1_9BACT|nr:MAG: hypothetical protein UR61_C0052G0001 [candidate division WS6 bacterium GW2011_GWE1_34_7]KKP77793.1 MAG: hypothetical protein UR73_C0011G0007 [candidate division WS6 bacterium GW2011_GWF1_35_23]